MSASKAIKFHQGAVRAATTAIAACLMLLATACSNEPSAEKGDALSSANAERSASSPKSRAASSPIPKNRIYAFDASLSSPLGPITLPETSALALGGSCLKTEPLSIGFTYGGPSNPNLFALNFESVLPIGPGETGEFQLSDLVLHDGAKRPDDLPEGLNLLIPITRKSDNATLTLTRHDAANLETQRMVGTIEGVVKDEKGIESNLTASFDIHMSCGIL